MPTKIEWAEETRNPIVGCSEISEACEKCYAKRLVPRLASQFSQYQGLVEDGRWTGKLALSTSKSGPLSSLPGKACRVFVGSMTDMFHEVIVDQHEDWLDKVGQDMSRAPQHTYMFLTKRPEKAREFINSQPENSSWRKIWLGVTVESQKHIGRIRILAKIQVGLRFVSCEPLLGPISLAGPYLKWLDWVIVGSQTGQASFIADEEWFLRLQRQCNRSDTPFFLKKIGRKNHVGRVVYASRIGGGKLWRQIPGREDTLPWG